MASNTNQPGGCFLPADGALVTGQWTFTAITLGMFPTIYAASAAIPPVAGTALLTKATAAAMTLAAPDVSIDGALLVISSETAAAHTVTGVGLIADGVTGSPHGTATFAAFKGASLTLMAANKLWNVIANNNVTIA